MLFVSLPDNVRMQYDWIHGPFDSTRPTLLVLSPTMHDFSSYEPLWSAPALAEWNILTVVLRFHQGKTTAPALASYDFTVAAADLATLLETLQLPPVHIYAPGTSNFHTALNLALLFPSCVLSLSFAGIYSFFTPQAKAIACFEELDRSTEDPDDREDFLEAIGGLLDVSFGDFPVSDETLDKVASIFINRYTPRNALGAHHHTAPFRQAKRIRRSDLAEIKIPVLITHGALDLAHEALAVKELEESLVNSKEVSAHVFEDGPHSIDLTHQAQIISLFTPFLTRHNDTLSTTPTTLDRSFALRKASTLANDPSILSRDPLKPNSYSILSEEKIEQTALEYAKKLERQREFEMWIPGENLGQKEEEEEIEGRQKRVWRYSRRHQHQFGDQPLFDEGRRSSVGGSIHVERVSSSIEEVLPQWKGSRDEVTPLAKVVEALSVVA